MNSKKKLFITLYFLFLLVIGFLIFPDYGISLDEDNTRINGFVTLKYISEIFSPSFVVSINEIINVPSMNNWSEQGIGVIFDLPTAFIELYFGITDSKNYYQMRHFVNFVFYFISVYFFFLLAKKRFNSLLFGLLGATLLVLSPRIFAQSFYNNKDIIFMSFFIIGLFTFINLLNNPSYKNATFFSLASALSIDIRILGTLLPCLFFFFIFLKMYREKEFRDKAIKPLFFLILSLPLFTIIFWPYLWLDPIEKFFLVFKTLSNYSSGPTYILYFGEFISPENLKWHYPLIWIFVTTPILYIFLFIIGFTLIFLRLVKRIFRLEADGIYNDFWRGKNELQDLLFLSTLIIPLFLIIILNSTLYDGWRHLYFIYPSFLMISLTGLYYAKILFFKNRERLVFSIVLIFLLPTTFWMYKNHPYQNVYFNIFAGKNFNEKFEMDYWGVSNSDALKYIANKNKNKVKVAAISTTDLLISKKILAKSIREKIDIVYDISKADYIINNFRDWNGIRKPNDFKIPNSFKVLSEIKVDGISINTIYKRNED